MSFSISKVSVQDQLDQLLCARVEQASRTVTKKAQAAQNYGCVGNCPFSYLVFWSRSESRFSLAGMPKAVLCYSHWSLTINQNRI
jgi:hypothetical protein